jgi:hypothetical protein
MMGNGRHEEERCALQTCNPVGNTMPSCPAAGGLARAAAAAAIAQGLTQINEDGFGRRAPLTNEQVPRCASTTGSGTPAPATTSWAPRSGATTVDLRTQVNQSGFGNRKTGHRRHDVHNGKIPSAYGTMRLLRTLRR